MEVKNRIFKNYDFIKQLLVVLIISWLPQFREDYRIYQRLITYANEHHLPNELHSTILIDSIIYGVYSIILFATFNYLYFRKKSLKQTVWIIITIFSFHPFICYFFEKLMLDTVGSNSQSHIEFFKLRLAKSVVIILGLLIYQKFSKYYKINYLGQKSS